MDRYKNILVALNLTKMDKPVIQYASIIGNMAHAENIYFMYVNRGLNIPEEIMVQYPQLRPFKDISESTMQEKAVSDFEKHSIEKLHFNAVAGNPIKELLLHITNKDIDLVVVGRKSDSRGTRMLPLKITRKATCSVLVIPEDITPAIKKILVPIDFSKNSAKALNVAIAIASTQPNATIQCLHIYELPIGYSKTGKSPEEFAEIMRANTVKSYNKFISKIDLKGIKTTAAYVLNKRTAVAIKKVIKKNNIDIVIVGARGLSHSAGVLLGSVTEELVLTTKIPLMAVKNKGEGIKFLEAFIKYV